MPTETERTCWHGLGNDDEAVGRTWRWMSRTLETMKVLLHTGEREAVASKTCWPKAINIIFAWGYVDCGRAAQEAGAAGRFASDSERIRAEGLAADGIARKIAGRIAGVLQEHRGARVSRRQIFHALYAERKFNVAEMTNLPGGATGKAAAARLASLCRRCGGGIISKDGSVRYLFGIGEERKSL